ncbi:MAG: hypothetical protein MZV70_39670 [Desulfobacterales bacterium]|nr:hypothetical protein [Desulfobacterales bacterium]
MTLAASSVDRVSRHRGGPGRGGAAHRAKPILGSPVHRRMRAILDRITPLNLIDPDVALVLGRGLQVVSRHHPLLPRAGGARDVRNIGGRGRQRHRGQAVVARCRCACTWSISAAACRKA